MEPVCPVNVLIVVPDVGNLGKTTSDVSMNGTSEEDKPSILPARMDIALPD